MQFRKGKLNSYTENGSLGETKAMETKITLVESQFKDTYKKKIIQMCFDDKSIANFSPGLKMIFALNDPPLFVELEEITEGSLAASSN